MAFVFERAGRRVARRVEVLLEREEDGVVALTSRR